MSVSNLPVPPAEDSAAGTKLYFDTYGQTPLEFSANEVNAVTGFFLENGFSDEASQVTAAVILKQAKLDGVPPFQLLDTLKRFNGIQLSALIGEILNNNRNPTSVLGFRTNPVIRSDQSRSIAP